MANEWKRATFSLIPNTAPNHTIANAMNVIGSFLVSCGWELASWSPSVSNRYYIRTDRATQSRWRYTGDGVTQSCGIRISQETSNTEIHISAFLENTSATGVQLDARDAPLANANRQGKIVISFEVTAANNYLMIAGEDGFYIEAGRDSSNVNLGHGIVATMAEITELNATKSAQVMWTTQGFALDFFGSCRFTTSRNNRFVTNDGTNRNFTASLSVFSARGVTTVLGSPAPADYPSYPILNRDLLLGQTANNANNSDWNYAATFGVLSGPVDDRYRLMQIIVLQDQTHADAAVSSTSTSNTLSAASTGPSINFRDIRHDRQILRLAIVDYTLLPFVNLTEAQTGKVYRVFEFNDNGRTANLGIEWPTVVVTPSAT